MVNNPNIEQLWNPGSSETVSERSNIPFMDKQTHMEEEISHLRQVYVNTERNKSSTSRSFQLSFEEQDMQRQHNLVGNQSCQANVAIAQGVGRGRNAN